MLGSVYCFKIIVHFKRVVLIRIFLYTPIYYTYLRDIITNNNSCIPTK